MESKKTENNDNSNDKDKKPEKEEPKETNKDNLAEEDNLFLNFLKNAFMNEQANTDDKDKDKDKEKPKESKTIKTFSKLNNTESSFLSASITKLKNGDDMDIMTELMLLCEQLSLSSDQIGDNPNMPKLLEEICKNLEKLYLPEIIIYSLQCINYILDINPGLTSVLKRIGAIPKIVILISAMEDTTCLESIVSIFEKISFENSFLLLENNVFLSLLNVIDFLGSPQRKSIMKICQNISANTLTYKQFDTYIKPALEPLCYLTKFSEDNSVVNEKAIIIYHNIILVLNQGYYFNSNPEIENELSKYSFMDNFCEILKKYFIESNKKITADIVKKILKIINVIFKVSKKETDKLLSLNFLEIVVEIIHHEFNDVISNDNNKITISKSDSDNVINTAKSSASFLTELFSLLTSLFPDKIKESTDDTKNKNEKKVKDEKILRKENEKYYNYLCINIIKPLVNNIINKSACSTLNNLVKLILVFSKTASKENIQNCINSKQMAQIVSKLLDTKYEPYVYDLISLLEIFMSKTPEHFIKNFIREGIIENIKNYDFNPKKSSENSKKKTKKKEKKESDNKDKDKDKENDSFSDILDNENNNEYSDGYIEMENENQNDDEYNNDNEEQNESGNEEDYLLNIGLKDKNKDNKDNKDSKDIKDEGKATDKEKEKEKDNIKQKDDKKDKEKDSNKIDKKVIKKEDEKNEKKDKDEKKEKEKDDKKEEKNDKDKDKKELKFDDIGVKSLLEQQKLLNDILEKTRKLKAQDYELMNQGKKIILETKIKDLVEKYLTDEKIKSYLDKIKFTELINLKDTLIKLEKELKNACDKKDEKEIKSVLEKILKILSEPKNEITLFELENSGILIGLCNYFEPIFKTQYDKLNIENDNELQKNINLSELLPNPLTINSLIFDRTKLFLECITENRNKLINYIKILEYSITSMNCFTMIIDDSQSNYNLNAYYNQTMRNVKKFDLRVIYSDSSYVEKIENNTEIDDSVFKGKLIEYNDALKSMKEVKFLLSENSVFDDMSSILLSNTNVTFVANENYDVTVVYFLNLKVNGKIEKFEINDEWGIRDLKKALLKKYGRTQGPLYFGSPIYFGLNYKKKVKEDKKEKEQKEETEKQIKGFIDYLAPFGSEIKSYEELLDFDKISFIKEYHTNIIYSKSLYEIKRLMPSLFLLSILYLSLKKYRALFNLNEEWFKNKKEWNDLFINSKVTLLISKASMDGSSVSKSSVPSWCKNLSIDCGFLTKYDARNLLFKVSFDPRRSLINLQNYLKSIDPNYPNEYNITLEKSMRLKIIVDRNKILDHGFTLLNDAVTSKFFGFLEFEYIGEIGNGLGPTLEFFHLVFEKLIEDKKLWYKTTDGSLYPNLGLNDNKEAIKLFKLLGYIIGRAIYDDRLMDIPLSRVLWNLLLERPVLLKDMEIIDKNLYKAVSDFKNLIKIKKDLIKNNPNISDEEIENKVLYNNKKLKDLDLYFTFPGYNDIELKEGGSDILLTMKNVEEYVNLIYDFIFYKGIDRVVTAFKEGFGLIYNLFNLKMFTSVELEEYICGSLEIKWDEDTLYENLKPEHGYTKKSRIFNDIIKFMCKLDKNGQREFLIFTTGTSRLPNGGFKALSPKLTIVKKTFDGKDSPDKYLPTVMTCQNYLKLPDYSSYEILESKLLLAMREGSKEFSLS